MADAPQIYAGRFGLGGKEYLPADVVACFDNLEKETPKNHFVVGIVDDVTNLSLERTCDLSLGQEGLHACKFWALAPTERVAPISRQLRLSATIRICMRKAILLMIRRDRAA
mgnify:CR=1 FL=1